MSRTGTQDPFSIRLAPEPGQMHLLLATLTLVLLPLAGDIPWAILGLAGLLIGWRAAAEWRGWGSPPAYLRATLAVAGLLFVLVRFRGVNGLDAGTTLLVLMLALKLLETRTVRDCALLVFLGFFLLLAGLLHSQSIPRALALIPAVGLLTVNLLVVTHPRG
ncbi:MAG: transglutaminaseTgpA domain-containing protein, partial [Gammaproteobacteria bacterium]